MTKATLEKRFHLRPLDLLLVVLIGLPAVAAGLVKDAKTEAVTTHLPPPPDPNPVVAIVHRDTSPDAAEVALMVQEAVTRTLGASGLSALVVPSDTVVIKINLGEGYETHQTADWAVVAPLAQMAWDAGAERVVIAEGNTPRFSEAGYYDHMPAGTEIVDLCTVGDFYSVTVEGGYWAEPIIIPQLYYDADVVITVPAFKTHQSNGVTFGLKNAVGVPPVDPYNPGPPISWRERFHTDYGIHGTVSQINLARPPDLVVVDGLEGCEGQGPWTCTSVEGMNLILAARDPVALDRVGLEIMGCGLCQPRRITDQVFAAYKNLGVNDLAAIQVVGTPIEAVQQAFAMPAPAEEIYRATTVIEAREPGRMVTVDGELGDWSGVRSIALGEAIMALIGGGQWAGPDDLSSVVLALYDSGNLYIALAVRDGDKLVNTATPVWDGDGIELYINSPDPWDVAFSDLPGGDEFWLGVAYGPSLTLWDIGRNQAVAEAEVALADTAAGYIVELRIPWAALGGFQALENRQIGFDIGLNDDDAGNGRQTWLSWGAPVAPATPPGDPATWGVALLGSRPRPTAVDLVSFTASAQGNTILLGWETATEIDTLGFNLYRGVTPSSASLRLNEDPIPSKAPGSLYGATYTWLDENIVPGIRYYYWLQDVGNYGVTALHGPVQTAGHWIYLPLVTNRR
jgi:uncharacterized protein (DUF362 family)